jgi:hypothetical protein
MSATDAVPRMTGAAQAFLRSLDERGRRAARLAFPADDARRDWTYLPGQRRGLSLADMDRSQAKAAHRLLAAGLSAGAYAQASTIIALEDVLDELEGGTADRHSGDYWVTVFGEPGNGAWGWRLEGHHLSVNHTIGEDATVRATPLFLGANPARLGGGGGVTLLEPLAQEERLGFALMDAMSPGQRASAVVSDEAPSDILSRDRPRLEGTRPAGLPLAQLSGEAATLALALVSLYLARLPDGLAADQRRAVADGSLGTVHLAWAGAVVAGRPHYYRLQGPRLFVELDNTQDGANHVHTVWRDPEGDFGDDLLAAHYGAHHRPRE